MTNTSTLQEHGWDCIKCTEEILKNGSLQVFRVNTKDTDYKQYFIFGKLAWYKAQLTVNIFEDKIEISHASYKADYSTWFRVDYGTTLNKTDKLAQDILNAIFKNFDA